MVQSSTCPSFFHGANSLHPHLSRGEVRTSTPEDLPFQAFVVRHHLDVALRPDAVLHRRPLEGLRGTSIHTDQGQCLGLVPQDDTEHVQGRCPPDHPRLQDDEVADEIVQGGIVAEGGEALVTAATAAMMIGAEAEAVDAEGEEDARHIILL